MQQQQDINFSKWTPQTLLSGDYKNLGPPSKVCETFKSHLLTSDKCLASLLDILFLETGKTGVHDYSLQIDMHDFLQSDPVLSNLLLRYPATLLPVLEESIVAAQLEIMKRIDSFYGIYNLQNVNTNGNTNIRPTAAIKGQNATRVHARLVNLPPHSSNHKPSLSSLTSHDVGKILQLSGTVTRTSTVQMYESQRAYQCKQKKQKGKLTGCNAKFVVKADLQCSNNALCQPVKCPTAGCCGKDFEIIKEMNTNGSTTGESNAMAKSDYQEIKVQESIAFSSKNSRTGAIPRALLIKLQHDLVDVCQPGDDVVIVGTLMSHWDQLVVMGEVNIGMAMHAHSIRVVSNGGGGGSGDGTAWEGTFENDVKDGSEEEEGEGLKRTGMVREEIVQEFSDFWKLDIHQKNPIAARNFICQAICPALYGMSLVKFALLLTLIGGSGEGDGPESDHLRSSETRGEACSAEDNDFHAHANAPVQFSLDNDDPLHSNEPQNTRNRGVKQAGRKEEVKTRRREQSHLLLVGDPGCGKSQFLRYAATLCPRSVFTNGSGTSSAGLTCAATREKSTGQWVLEAGALVLADRGVCAIDEFSCIKPADRTTIHEAMEQQTLSVAKAGIVCKLNCRTTVIAVTNAKGGFYDHEKSFNVNVGIEPPLLSRFDLIFKLIDGGDATKDDNVATFLLNRAIQGSGYECAKATNNFSKRSPWNIDKLRAYIATIKSCFHPTISPDASMLLERHYSECRISEYIEVQVTVRLLESLIRLSQAHARLMHRNVVELDDAVAVILLMECSVASTSASSFNTLFRDPTTTVFPDEDGTADMEFILDKRKVLEKYELLEYLTPDEAHAIENYNAGTIMHSDATGWENIETNLPVSYPSSIPIGGASMQQEWSTTNPVVATQDHYGRYTQKATPSKATHSPSSSMKPRNDNQLDQRNDIDQVFHTQHQGFDHRKPKRRRNHSAD